MEFLRAFKSRLYLIAGVAILVVVAAAVSLMFATNAKAETENYGEYVPGEVIVCVQTDPYYGDIDNSNNALSKINDQMNSFLGSYDSQTLLCFTGNDAVYDSVANDSSMITVKDVSDSNAKPAQTRYVKIKFDESQKSMSQMIAELKSLSIVKVAQPNNVVGSCTGENADFTSEQYAYDSEDGTAPNNKVGMNVANWNTTTKNIASEDKVVVAVIDSGVDYNHPDIKTADEVYGNLNTITGIGGEHGYNAGAYVGTDDTDPMDKGVAEHGHGTHVAGSVAAQWNNKGVSGGAYDCSILPVKATDSVYGKFFNDAIVRAYGYVIKAKQSNPSINIKAANNSWASSNTNKFISDLVTKAGQNGIVSVFGSGNDTKDTDINSYTISVLQNNPYAIAVNSSNQIGYPSDFSNYGLKTTDVFAPGQDIYSTIPSWQSQPGLDHNFMSSDTRFMDSSEYTIQSNFNQDPSTWKFHYYKDVDCKEETTTVAAGKGYLGGNALFIPDKSVTNANPTVYIQGDWSTLDNAKRITLLFKADAQSKIADRASCGIFDVNNPSGLPVADIYYSPAAAGEAQYCSISIQKSQMKNVDGKFKLGISFMYSDENFSRQQTDYYIDQVSLTSTEMPYNLMSGTSMSSPACCGVAAIIAAKYNESADKVAARIKGGTNHKSWLENKCYSGGIVDLGRALSNESELDPVVLDGKLVSSNASSSTIKLQGYFLGDSSSEVTINGSKATEVVPGTEGSQQTLTCTFPVKLNGSICVNVNKAGKSLNKYLDIGSNEDVLDRIPLPDSTNPDFADFYLSTSNQLMYASDDYLFVISICATNFNGYIFDINNQKWVNYNFFNEITKSFKDKGINLTNVVYLCANNNTLVFDCLDATNPTAPNNAGFAFYDMSTGQLSLDVINSSEYFPSFGIYENNELLLGCTKMSESKQYVYTYDSSTKSFNKISDEAIWGDYPYAYKLEDSKYLLIDTGSQNATSSTFNNNMYLLSLDEIQNGSFATVTKMDQIAFPTLVTDKNQEKITGHAIVNGMLMMIGPANIDQNTQGVIADTFLRNIQTQEEVPVSGVLSNTKVTQPFSASSGNYVYTSFMDADGPAIAKRYVGSPVPPDPGPQPEEEHVSSAATGDNTLSVFVAIFAIFLFAVGSMVVCRKKLLRH